MVGTISVVVKTSDLRICSLFLLVIPALPIISYVSLGISQPLLDSFSPFILLYSVVKIN